MADQQRWDTLGCNGNRFCETPHLDRLAAEGTRFTQAFTPFPLCAPARATAWTGVLPHRHGLVQNLYDKANSLGSATSGIETVFGRLQGAGYQTAYFGKWHLGNADPGTFNTWHGYNWQGSHWDDARYDFHGGEYTADLLTDQVIQFLQKHRGTDSQPLCMVVSYGPPHPPYTAPERFYQPYRNKGIPFAGYYAAVSAIDWNVGRLVSALDQSGIGEKSLVMFFSDHGETFMYRPGHQHKQSCYDDAIRIPFIVRAPGRAGKGRTVERPVGLEDLAPTALDYAGVTVTPSDYHGRSLRSSLEGGADEWRTSYYVQNFALASVSGKFESKPQRALRTSEWKLVAGAPGVRHKYFDLVLDPEEEIDLLAPKKLDHYQKLRHFPDVTHKIIEAAHALNNHARDIGDSVGQLLGQFVLAGLNAGSIDPALVALSQPEALPAPNQGDL